MSGCCSGPAESITGHFDAAIAGRDLTKYRTKGPNPTTRLLRHAIVRAGIGGTLIDVGGGIGAASFELLGAGYISSLIYDLSPAYLAAARAEAAERGLDTRIRTVEGDFALADARPTAADTVLMDRVVCCYPDFRALLGKALGLSTRLFAYSYPRDAWYVRPVFAFDNLLRAMKKQTFRAFVHSSAAMEELIVSRGFRRISRDKTIAWNVDVYRKEGRGS